MNQRIQTLFLALLVLGLCCVGNAQQSLQPLNNQSVIKLVRAGFKEKTVIAIIYSRPGQFDLSPDRLIELKRSGVGEQVILAMLAREGATVSATAAARDDLDDEGFFGGMDDPTAVRKGDKGSDGGFDIFGSSSGSRARTRSNGPDGSRENDSNTTGSATVRILRPPSEAGEIPKLEKTPSLTNDSVVDMVEAGFSEGTIVRRIEQSPADFDLSPAKLAELRRKRVSDRVILAMTTAMGDEPTKQPAGANSSPEK